MRLRKALLISSSSLLAVSAAAMTAAPAYADEPSTVQEVVVTGIRGSLEKAIAVKKNSDEIVEVISSEDIGKLPDKNVADALQRLPGLSTFSAASGEGGFDENDRIAIRGTPPSLTNVTVNGHYVSSGDWFILDQFQTLGRSISSTLIPSEIVGEVRVYKSQSADMLEGGTAGSVDIITRDPLGLHKSFTAELALGGVYTTLPGKTSPQLNGMVGWKNDAGTLGVIVQGFDETREIRRDGQEVLNYTDITSSMPIGAANPSLVANHTQFPGLIGSALFEQKRVRTGGDISIHYRPSDQFELSLDGFYSNLEATNHNANYMFWGSQMFGNVMPTSFTVKDNTVVSATFPMNPAYNGVVADDIYRVGAKAQTYYIDLSGKYHVNDRLTLSGQIGYTYGLGVTPSQPFLEVNAPTGASYTLGFGGPVSFTDIDPSTDTSLVNGWASNQHMGSWDHEWYGKIDADYRIDDGLFKNVKFGVRYGDHDHTSDGWSSGCSGVTAAGCGTGGTFADFNPHNYPGNFGDALNAMPGFLNNPLVGDWPTIQKLMQHALPVAQDHWYFAWSSHVHETDLAAYAMANVGGERWHGNFGVRVVQTRLDPYVNVSDPSGTHAGDIFSYYGPYYVDDHKHTYTNILPSANFSYDLTETLKLRVAAAETISMPDYSALGGSVSVQDTSFTGTGGNPDLRPVKAANYDASLEWYYRPRALAAVTLFYKDLSNYIDFGASNQVYYSEFYHQFETYSVTSPVNSSGQLQGFEIQIQQPLNENFGFLFNYSYTDSENFGLNGGRLIGTAKNVGNLTGWYENHWLSARLAYTYRSDVLVGLDHSNAEVQEPIGSLDAAVSVKVNDHVSLALDALNLTDSLLKYHARSETQPRAVYDNGRQFYLNLRMKF